MSAAGRGVGARTRSARSLVASALALALVAGLASWGSALADESWTLPLAIGAALVIPAALYVGSDRPGAREVARSFARLSAYAALAVVLLAGASAVATTVAPSVDARAPGVALLVALAAFAVVAGTVAIARRLLLSRADR